MDYSRIFAISGAGMTAERTRVEVAALNLANANTSAQVDGTVYSPQRVVARSVPLQATTTGFAAQISDALVQPNRSVTSVPEVVIYNSDAPPRAIYEPGHPLANTNGFVMQPNVDGATEMLTVVSAMRAYEANVAVANSARTLALKTLELGGGS